MLNSSSNLSGMNLNESDLKHLVQEKVRSKELDTKYNNEDVSVGQAVVTHHFYEMMKQGKLPQMPVSAARPATN